MKLYQCLLCILALVVGLHAADPDFNIYSSCSISCQNELSSNCSTNSTPCYCQSSSNRDSLLACVTSNCTTKELLITTRLTEEECGLHRRQGPAAIHPSTLAPLVLATVFFFIRLFAKFRSLGGGWGLDDYTITASWVMGVALYTLNVYMIHYGFGKNIWDVPFGDLVLFYKYFYAFAVMYKVQISLAKISVCLFLLRIFQSRTFRYISYLFICLNAAVSLTWACIDSFRCTPIHLAWDGWANEEPGHCIDFITAILINCLVNIFVDSIIVFMPVYEVSKLQLPLQKKISVGLMFIMGSVLTIIAIIRVVVFWNNRWGANQTAGIYPLIHWSVIESNIAVMCACLPAASALIRHYFPGILGASTRRTYPSGPSHWYNPGQSNGNSKISKSVSYSVNYTSRSQRDDSNSDVNLVEMDGKLVRK